MENNATDRRQDYNVPINSIQSTAYVERIAVDKFYSFDDVYQYDLDNLYPQKYIEAVKRSWSASSATETLSDFIAGDGFVNEELNELEVNSDGVTMYEILVSVAKQKAKLGFALHFNYDISGRITDINEIDFEAIREGKYGMLYWNYDWATRYTTFDYEIQYHRFNPDNAINEIKEVGIENYNGQVMYWTGTGKIYPTGRIDSALDAAQYQAENELFKLRNIQNDFSASGAYKYPKNLDKDSDFQQVKEKIKHKGTGANNAGRVLLVGVTQDTDLNGKMWESFERSNVDKLYTEQNREAKEAIFSSLRQPMILGAVTYSGGWPNKDELNNAYVYYNSIVERDRKDIERQLAKIFKNSVWGEKDVEIKPKILIKEEQTNKTGENNGTGGLADND